MVLLTTLIWVLLLVSIWLAVPWSQFSLAVLVLQDFSEHAAGPSRFWLLSVVLVLQLQVLQLCAGLVLQVLWWSGRLVLVLKEKNS